ncbi:MAG: dienelactone hydrolase family protein [Ilumatobacter sp.]|uniref:dienelactone hydrolase family protein n=1 Tax=Ilumatobacter sp. TaxID=1967498 RepID=UPI003299D925
MGQMIEFAAGDIDARGYLATPESGSGPGVIVVQEWWGLDSGIKGMADRLADNGFVALAPDLYHGELAEHTEMDKAGELMNSMPPERAAADMSGAVDALLARSETTGDGVGVVGFCMGGMLTFLLAATRPDAVKAAVPFYGYPSGDDGPDVSKIEARIQGHFAETDDFFGPEGVRELEQKLQDMGKQVTLTVHQGTGHAFMSPHDALDTYDEQLAETIWPQFTGFLHEILD